MKLLAYFQLQLHFCEADWTFIQLDAHLEVLAMKKSKNFNISSAQSCLISIEQFPYVIYHNISSELHSDRFCSHLILQEVALSK
jgi:hypothetical protein